MAPEVQAGRGADARSDLYGFAVTMIHSMLGRFPYAGDPDSRDDDRTVLVQPTEDERRFGGRWARQCSTCCSASRTLIPLTAPTSVGELEDELRLIEDIPEGEGAAVINPVVDSFRGLYRASCMGNAGNRGLDDAFARETYVPTLLDTELLPAILRGRCGWCC